MLCLTQRTYYCIFKIRANTNPRIGGIVIVAVAIVVNIGKPRGRHRITEPPIRTNKDYPSIRSYSEHSCSSTFGVSSMLRSFRMIFIIDSNNFVISSSNRILVLFSSLCFKNLLLACLTPLYKAI